MKDGIIIGGALLLLIGAVWFLQGVGVLGGGMMSGQTFWAVAGVVVGTLGGIVLRRGLRRSAA